VYVPIHTAESEVSGSETSHVHIRSLLYTILNLSNTPKLNQRGGERVERNGPLQNLV
jgi:hypothetical protein